MSTFKLNRRTEKHPAEVKLEAIAQALAMASNDINETTRKQGVSFLKRLQNDDLTDVRVIARHALTLVNRADGTTVS